jgi:putative methionine-R-sulfoxide reductase with GAF domain
MDRSSGRYLRRFKAALIGGTALLIAGIELVYYLRGVPLVDSVIGGLVALAGATALIQISFRSIGESRKRLQQEADDRKEAESALRARTRQLEALRSGELEISAQLDLDALLHSIVSQSIRLLGSVSGGFYLYRPERDLLEWAVAAGPYAEPLGVTLRKGEGLSGSVWETGTPLIVDDYRDWEGRARAFEGQPYTAIVGVPVSLGKEFLGVLVVLADPPRVFSREDMQNC